MGLPEDHTPAQWTVADGVMTVNKSAGNIETKRKFKNYQLHIEWRIPDNITGSGQSHGNSGDFLASTGPGDIFSPTGVFAGRVASFKSKSRQVCGRASVVRS